MREKRESTQRNRYRYTPLTDCMHAFLTVSQGGGGVIVLHEDTPPPPEPEPEPMELEPPVQVPRLSKIDSFFPPRTEQQCSSELQVQTL